MNKKLLGLVAAFFVAGAQAAAAVTPTNATVTPGVADFRTFINYPAQTFRDYQSVKEIETLVVALQSKPFLKEYQDQRQFERAEQTAILSFAGVAFSGFLVCALMEWFQDYKLKVAAQSEKIANIERRIQHLRATHSRS